MTEQRFLHSSEGEGGRRRLDLFYCSYQQSLIIGLRENAGRRRDSLISLICLPCCFTGKTYMHIGGHLDLWISLWLKRNIERKKRVILSRHDLSTKEMYRISFFSCRVLHTFVSTALCGNP